MASDFFVQASEFLPDDRLRELAKCTDLSSVHHLTFSVDTSENSLGDLGHRLPALRQLRLDGSNIATLRDLGTGMSELRILWLARSSLRELEGIGAFGALTELYLAFNEVEDLSPLMGAERLQVLDLEANAIADAAQVHYLQGCDQLHSLTLEGNPIAESAEYRSLVLEALPQLCVLDDVATDGSGGEGLLLDAHALLSLDAQPAPLSAPRPLPAPLPPTRRDAQQPGGGGGGGDGRSKGDIDRELRLIRDGIKYTDALRAYDVQSREALTAAGGGARGGAGEYDDDDEYDECYDEDGRRDARSARSGSDHSGSAGGEFARARQHGGKKGFGGPLGTGSVTSEGTISTAPGSSAPPGSRGSGHGTAGPGPTNPMLATMRANLASRGSSSAGGGVASSLAGSRLTTASSGRGGGFGGGFGGGSRGGGGEGLLSGGDDADGTSSVLTYGDDILVCGNPTQALRAKRRSMRAASAASADGGSSRGGSSRGGAGTPGPFEGGVGGAGGGLCLPGTGGLMLPVEGPPSSPGYDGGGDGDGDGDGGGGGGGGGGGYSSSGTCRLLGPLDETEASEAAKAAAAHVLASSQKRGRGGSSAEAQAAAEEAELLEELYRYKLCVAAAGGEPGGGGPSSSLDGASSSDDEPPPLLASRVPATAIPRTAPSRSSGAGRLHYGAAVGDEESAVAPEQGDDGVLLLDVS